MIESIVAGLVLAGISGSTFIAYKHPVGFARMFRPAAILATSIAAGLCAWQVMDVVSSASVIEHLAAQLPNNPLASVQDEAAKLIGALHRLAWISTVYVAIVLYLAFLRWLPRALKGESSNKRVQATRETRAPDA